MSEIYFTPPVVSDYVDVSDIMNFSRQKLGKVYEKHILSRGSLRHPVTKKIINIDDKFLNTMVKNFHEVGNRVSTPLADENNRHNWRPDLNIGEVIDLKVKDHKLYAYMDIRKKDLLDAPGKTILDVSASFDTNFENTTTGENVGPTLLHACATNNAYILGLEDYKEIVSASSDTKNSVVLLSADVDEEQPTTENGVYNQIYNQVVESLSSKAWAAFGEKFKTESTPRESGFVPPDQLPVLDLESPDEEETTETPDLPNTEESIEENEMPKATRDELISQLKEEFGIDVEALEAAAKNQETAAKELETATALTKTLEEKVELSNKRTETLEALVGQLKEKVLDSGVVGLTKNQEELSPEDVVSGLISLTNNTVELTNKVQELSTSNEKLLEKSVRAEVIALSREGQIPPAKVDFMTKVKLRDEKEGTNEFDEWLSVTPAVELSKETGVLPEDHDKQMDVNEHIARLKERNKALFGPTN